MENKARQNFIKSEAQTILSFKNNNISEREAEAIIDQRCSGVEISFDSQQQRWVLMIFKNSELIFTKTTAFSNRQGVVNGIWHFINPSDEVPWMMILKGKLWRSEDIILDHLFWLKVNNDDVAGVRRLLLMKPVSLMLH